MNLADLSFVAIWVFILLPLPILVWRLLPLASDNTAALRIPFYQGVCANTISQQTPSKIRLILAVLAWILLLIAAARPQFMGETISQQTSGRSLMMAVDISGSMKEDDMRLAGKAVSRLVAVKAVASDFITQRQGDRIGLILFGSQAYLQVPLTFDLKTITLLLNEAELGLAGQQTAIGDAIGLAVKRLRNEPEADRVLILLTDGANTTGNIDPLKAADLAAQEKVRVYTIGVGSDARMMRTPFGLRKVDGTDLDEKTLSAIADKTGGRYFRARDVKGLQEIYAVLDEIEPISTDELSYRPIKELYYYPLSIALLLSVLIVLWNTLGRVMVRFIGEDAGAR
jgi:Ca-activated chloride channel family protein